MARPVKLLDWAARHWPLGHSRFEELCSMAAAGLSSGPEMQELDRHLAECAACRGLLSELSSVSVQAASLVTTAVLDASEGDPPEGIRSRFLDRLAAEQPIANRVVEMPRPELIVETEQPPSKQEARLAKGRQLQIWRVAAAVFAGALIGFAGFTIGQRPGRRAVTASNSRVTSPEPVHRDLAVVLPARSTANPEDSERIATLQHQKAQLRGELEASQKQLDAVTTEKQSLATQLATLQDKLNALSTQSLQASQISQSEVQAARTQMASLQDLVQRLRQEVADSDRSLNAEKRTAGDLAMRLDATEGDLQREREIKAARTQMGELIGARNLHIVDVYDADGNGQRQNVGRVFYIENKSLVFYAYDLDKPGRFKTNVAFQVWGNQIENKGATHNLGILRKDDAGENRWALTFDDPKILAQINSVFVTAEATNRRQTAPSGRKILYAYFGDQPNHPGGF